jgi:hypothetical protein
MGGQYRLEFFAKKNLAILGIFDDIGTFGDMESPLEREIKISLKNENA